MKPVTEPSRSEPVQRVPPPARSTEGLPAKSWSVVADRLKKIADELQALAQNLPASDPDADQGRAVRSAAGRISGDIGTLKRRMGVGRPSR